ncbi:Aste57867_13695 [Aphanomyces stellatus]|uniref:Aste57867_13695 protein n=1 Tax=Aphanomyces stellatus TaxID=120398 RepID=A0A485KZI1_9STRA|nr:hypothetical protein As57867_013645 [Aphanomyces stellatus]VFT90528.1 Aste57867_13695 [Aphanomyces stellatus]
MHSPPPFSRIRRDSLFGDNDLFAGYPLDPLTGLKDEQGGNFEPLDHANLSMPLTPLHKIDLAMYPTFNTSEFELRVPQLASTYDYSGNHTPNTQTFLSLTPQHHHHYNQQQQQHQQQHHQHQQPSQQPSSSHSYPPPPPMTYQDMRAHTTISSSPAIEVRKFPADHEFRKFQLANHVLPIASTQRSLSESHFHKAPSSSLQQLHQSSFPAKVPVQRSTTVPTTARDLTQLQPTYKSKGKRCTEAGCTRRAQSNNRCKAHGGGARCQHPGCPKSSQGGGFCRAHGGGKKCEFQGCTKGQQRKGFCYAHGGIRKCKHASCDKKDRGNGFCIAHGGGKRCSSDGCMNAVRKGRFCRAHMTDE